MRLEEVMSGKVETVAPDVPVARTRELMRSRRIGHLAVVARGKLVGILSERDLVLRVVGKGLDPHRAQVGRIMTTPVTTVGP